MSEYEIKHVMIATGSPHANGQVERVNRVIVPMLSKLVSEENSKVWNRVLPEIEFALNNTVSKRAKQRVICYLEWINEEKL